MRRLALAFIALFVSIPSVAQTAALPVQYCTAGGTQATTQGSKSTNYLQGVIPSCSVTVYLTGTTTLATIYSDKLSTPLANPFTASNKGAFIIFAAVNQGYDVVLSGGVAPNTYPAPVTIVQVYPSQQIINPGGGTVNTTSGYKMLSGPSASGAVAQATNCYSDVTGNNVTCPGAMLAQNIVINAGQFGVKCDGANDDTTAIQAALTYANAQGGGVVLFPPGNGTCNFIGGLVIYSNTKLDVGKHHMLRVDTVAGTANLLNESFLNPVRTCTDIVSTNASATISSATCNFTSADVGRSITCAGIGYQATYVQPLTARIVSSSGSTNAVLDTAAGKNATGVSCVISNVDQNIEVMGGNWDRASITPGTFFNSYGFVFEHADHTYFHDLQISTTTIQGYATIFGDTQYTHVENIVLDQHKDSIHFAGPGSYATIRNIKGTGGDDLVALIGMSMGGSFNSYHDTAGDFNHFVISNLDAATYASGSMNLVDMSWGGFYDILISGISGHSKTGAYCPAHAIGIQDALNYPPSIVSGLVVDGVGGCFVNTMFNLQDSQGQSITLKNLHTGTGSAANYPVISVNTAAGGGPTTHINSLSIDGWTKDQDGVLNNGLLAIPSGSIDTLILNNLTPYFDTAGSQAIVYASATGTIGSIVGANIAPYYGKTGAAIHAFSNANTSSAIGSISLSNVTLNYASGATGPGAGGALIHGPFGIIKVANSHFNFNDTSTSYVIDNVNSVAGEVAQVTNSTMTQGSGFFIIYGANAFTAQVDGYASIGSKYFVYSTATGALDVGLNGFTGGFSQPPFRLNSGTADALNIRCGSINPAWSGTGLQHGAGTLTMNVFCPQFPIDIALLQNTLGASAYNTNAGSGQLGPNINNGSAWLSMLGIPGSLSANNDWLGTNTFVTQAVRDNSTKAATTAYADAASNECQTLRLATPVAITGVTGETNATSFVFPFNLTTNGSVRLRLWGLTAAGNGGSDTSAFVVRIGLTANGPTAGTALASSTATGASKNNFIETLITEGGATNQSSLSRFCTAGNGSCAIQQSATGPMTYALTISAPNNSLFLNINPNTAGDTSTLEWAEATFCQ